MQNRGITLKEISRKLSRCDILHQKLERTQFIFDTRRTWLLPVLLWIMSSSSQEIWINNTSVQNVLMSYKTLCNHFAGIGKFRNRTFNWQEILSKGLFAAKRCIQYKSLVYSLLRIIARNTDWNSWNLERTKAADSMTIWIIWLALFGYIPTATNLSVHLAKIFRGQVNWRENLRKEKKKRTFGIMYIFFLDRRRPLIKYGVIQLTITHPFTKHASLLKQTDLRLC